MTNKNKDTLKIQCTKKYSTISQRYKILIRAQLVCYKTIIFYVGVIILYLIVIIKVQFIPFIIIIIIYFIIFYQIKYIFYKYIIKGVIILYLIVIIPIKFIHFVIIIIIYFVIVYQIKYILNIFYNFMFYNFMIKQRNTQAFNQYLTILVSIEVSSMQFRDAQQHRLKYSYLKIKSKYHFLLL